MSGAKRQLNILLALVVIFASLLPAPAARAVSVSATGTNPAVCDQQVNDATGVTATRLAGGDCLVKFTSTGISYSWTAPSNLYSVTYLVVGGGGSGGTGWDSVGAGGGGGGMVLAGTYRLSPNLSYSIIVGAGGIQSTNARSGNNGFAGGASSFGQLNALGGGLGFTARGSNGTIQAGGSKQNSSIAAAIGGSGGYSGGAGAGGGGGASANGSNGSGASAGSGGAGISNSITDSVVTYGAGGAGGVGSTTATGASGAANTGNGGAGGSGGGAASASGGVGGSGVVMIRYSTTSPTVNSFALSGAPFTAMYRGSTTINLNVNVSATATFLADGKRIAGCISLPASGSASSYSSSCTWSPTKKGAVSLMALITPTSPGFASFTSTINISVVTRTGSR